MEHNTQQDSAAVGPDNGREILLRVASAAVMAPLGLAAVWFGGVWIILATGLCAMLAALEWTRMAAQTRKAWGRPALYGLTGLAAGVTVIVGANDFGLAALSAAVFAAAAGVVARMASGHAPSMIFGVLYTSMPFAAFVWIREATPDGRLTLLALLAIVWATDIAAYFAGRGFGGPLLSPKDSPNKTWNGAIGALVCACLAGAAVARSAGGDFAHWLIASLIVSIIAQAGDLLESRFKRLYGVKDTSGLMPGHGGVLDRLDALMAAVFFWALALWLVPGLVPDFGGAITR